MLGLVRPRIFLARSAHKFCWESRLTRSLHFVIDKCRQTGKQITAEMHGPYSPPMHIYRII